MWTYRTSLYLGAGSRCFLFWWIWLIAGQMAWEPRGRGDPENIIENFKPGILNPVSLLSSDTSSIKSVFRQQNLKKLSLEFKSRKMRMEWENKTWEIKVSRATGEFGLRVLSNVNEKDKALYETVTEQWENPRAKSVSPPRGFPATWPRSTPLHVTMRKCSGDKNESRIHVICACMYTCHICVHTTNTDSYVFVHTILQ